MRACSRPPRRPPTPSTRPRCARRCRARCSAAASRSPAPTSATSTPGPRCTRTRRTSPGRPPRSRSSTRPRRRCCASAPRRGSTRRSSRPGRSTRRASGAATSTSAAPATRPSARRRSSTLAQTIAAQTGIRRVAGSVLGDESVFDSLRGSSRTGYAVDRDIVRRPERRRRRARLLARRRRPRRRPRGGWRRRCARPASPWTARAARARPRPRRPEVTGIDSPPVGDLIRFTNVPSDNFDAEMLLKKLGASFGGAGTTQAGVGVVRSQLATFGVHPRIVDGSGLSRADRTTPRQVVRLLERMSGTEVAHDVPGLAPGRRADRARCAAGCAARSRRTAARRRPGRCAAVSALAGYCQTTAGRNRRVRDAHVDPVHHPGAPRPGPDDRGDRDLRELSRELDAHQRAAERRVADGDLGVVQARLLGDEREPEARTRCGPRRALRRPGGTARTRARARPRGSRARRPRRRSTARARSPPGAASPARGRRPGRGGPRSRRGWRRGSAGPAPSRGRRPASSGASAVSVVPGWRAATAPTLASTTSARSTSARSSGAASPRASACRLSRSSTSRRCSASASRARSPRCAARHVRVARDRRQRRLHARQRRAQLVPGVGGEAAGRVERAVAVVGRARQPRRASR